MEVLLKRVNEFKVGERVDSYLLIKKIDLKTTNAGGKKFLDLILGDATGDINGKIWEVSPGMEELFQANMVVKVRGTVTSYNNQLQFKVERIRETSHQDEIKIEDLVMAAPLKAEDMYETILTDYIRPMANEDIRRITETIFTDYREKLYYYPAAKSNHHAIRSGLLYHVLTMLSVGEALTQIYAFLDRDLLYAGIILHDMCKMEEMDSSEWGVVKEYTVPGSLLGHISLGVENLGRVGRRLGADEEIILLLQHMVLSHHYEPEYGSPIKPMIPEAEMLHYIDVMDARMYDMSRIQNRLEPGNLSEYIPSLDRRRVYRPNYK